MEGALHPGYTAGVHLPATVMVLGAGAAWLAAPAAWFAPALWLAVLLVCLALPPTQRRLLDPRWVVVASALAAVNWLVALDREAAVGHLLTFAAAALLFALARLADPRQGHLELLAAAVGLAAVPALAQGAGALAQVADAVAVLPPGMREAAAARLATGRAFGTAALPGHFAALQLVVLPLLLAAVARHRGVKRAAFALLALLSWAGIAATRSLAALGAAAVLLGVAAARRRGPAVVAVGVGMLAAGAAATLLWRGDLATWEPIRLRWINWQVALSAWVQHPWLGVGLGGVGQAGLAGPLGAVNITPYAHNSYLQLVAELGVAGLGLLTAALVALIRLIARGVRHELALGLAVLVMPLHNVVDFSLYAPEVLLPWAVLLGALAARQGPPTRAVTPAPLLVPLLCGGLAVASLAFLAEERLHQARVEEDPGAALMAARLSPWAITPALTAAELALGKPTAPETVGEVLRLLESRAHLRPRSASVAEARARLLIVVGRRGEGCAWAAEARRRAPWRQELVDLGEACCGDSVP